MAKIVIKYLDSARDLTLYLAHVHLLPMIATHPTTILVDDFELLCPGSHDALQCLALAREASVSLKARFFFSASSPLALHSARHLLASGGVP
jgi:hypothetical protein